MIHHIIAFFKKYRHIWLLSYVFLYLPWFCYLERTVKTGYHIMHVALDDYIPFCEYFIIPYLMWFLYVGSAIIFFLFKSKEDYYRLCTFLFSGMTASLIICTFFRNGTDFRPMVDPDKNICSAIVSILYRTDTCTNVFPSIHVYNSIGVHIAVMKSELLHRHRLIRIGSGILMTAICLATVFLKQHSVSDGVGSLVMAYVVYWIVYGYGPATASKEVTEKVMG